MFGVTATLENTGENLKRVCWHADDICMSVQRIPLNFNLLKTCISSLEIRTPQSILRCDELSVLFFFFFHSSLHSVINTNFSHHRLISAEPDLKLVTNGAQQNRSHRSKLPRPLNQPWNTGLVASYVASIGLCQAHYAISRTGMLSQTD